MSTAKIAPICVSVESPSIAPMVARQLRMVGAIPLVAAAVQIPVKPGMEVAVNTSAPGKSAWLASVPTLRLEAEAARRILILAIGLAHAQRPCRIQQAGWFARMTTPN